MNPLFIIMLIMIVVLLWFLLAFAYKPIGKLFRKIWKDSVDAMKDTKKEKESEEEKS